MTKYTLQHFRILFFVCVVFTINISKAQPIAMSLSKDFKVNILGTSNLHDWSESVNEIMGLIKVYRNTDQSLNIQSLVIRMKVLSIKSEAGSIMNNNTYKALKSADFPEIIFELTDPISSIPTSTSDVTYPAKGNLSIAGIKKSILIQVVIRQKVNGDIQLNGSYQIKMTDFGIDPPTALFGTLKTADEVTIIFKTKFSPNNI